MHIYFSIILGGIGKVNVHLSIWLSKKLALKIPTSGKVNTLALYNNAQSDVFAILSVILNYIDIISNRLANNLVIRFLCG